MKLGNGFDIMSNEEKDSALLLDKNPMLDSLDTSLLNEAQLKSKVLKLPYSPGNYRLREFESLDDLKKMVSGSLGLAAKLPQLGLSLKVSASKTNRVDANFIYYLLELRSGDHALQLETIPDLSEYAKKSLGVVTPDIEITLKQIDAKKSSVDKVSSDLTAANKAKSDAESKLKAAKEAFDIAQKEDEITQAAYRDVPADRRSEVILKTLKDSQITLEKSRLQHTNATADFNQADQKSQQLAASLATQKHELDDLNVVLATQKRDALNGIDDAKIENFYRRFGTHFVNKCYFGRQFVALITIDRSEISQDSTLGVSGSLSYNNVSVEGGYNRGLSDLAKRLVVKIDIAVDGIKPTAIRSPKTIDELQDAIIKFTSDSNHTEQPSLIDFTLDSYSNILYAVGVKEPQVQHFCNRIQIAHRINERLYELRTTAIRYYSARYLYEYQSGGKESNPLIAQAGLKLENDPHSRRLEYLFSQLRDNILYLNKTIESLQEDIFKPVNNIMADPVAGNGEYAPPPINNLDAIKAQLDSIRIELEQRAGYKLLHICEGNVNNNTKLPKSKMYFTLPAKATRFHISVHKGLNEQQNAAIAKSAPQNGRPGDLVNPTGEAAHSLGWTEANEQFKVTLFQYRPGKVCKSKKWEIFTADNNQQSVDISPGVKNGGSAFCLKNGSSSEPALAHATVRVYASITDGKLSLDEVDQESKNIITRAIEQKTLPDSISAVRDSQSKCVLM